MFSVTKRSNLLQNFYRSGSRAYVSADDKRTSLLRQCMHEQEYIMFIARASWYSIIKLFKDVKSVISQLICFCQSNTPQSNICRQAWSPQSGISKLPSPNLVFSSTADFTAKFTFKCQSMVEVIDSNNYASLPRYIIS